MSHECDAAPATPTTPTPIPTARDALQARDALRAAYAIAMPSPVRKTASRAALAAENNPLRAFLKAAGIELDKNYAQMVLMDRENSNLRQQVFAKKNKPKRTYTTGKARLMTSTEMQEALLKDWQKKQMAQLHGEFKKKHFPRLKKGVAATEKAEAAAQKAVMARVKAVLKEGLKAALKASKQAPRRQGGRQGGGGVGRGQGGRGTGRGQCGGGAGRGRGRGLGNGWGPDDSSDDECNLQKN
jgi:hypothetical protein